MEKRIGSQETEDWLIAFLSGELDEREGKCACMVGGESREQNAYESLMKDYLRIRWVQENVHIREEQAKR